MPHAMSVFKILKHSSGLFIFFILSQLILTPRVKNSTTYDVGIQRLVVIAMHKAAFWKDFIQSKCLAFEHHNFRHYIYDICD